MSILRLLQVVAWFVVVIGLATTKFWLSGVAIIVIIIIKLLRFVTRD